MWSPDGKQFAFTNTVAAGIQLWIGTVATGQTRRIPNVTVNGVQVNDEEMWWMGDNRTLIVSTVPGGRGPAPGSRRSKRAGTRWRGREAALTQFR